MKNTNTIILSTLVVCSLIISVSIYLAFPTTKFTKLPTYFSYDESKLSDLKKLSSTQTIKLSDLQKWDAELRDLIISNKLGDVYTSRIFAYLYTAQRDAAFIAYNNSHTFSGSIDPVSAEVMCLFFVKECSSIKTEINTDIYSDEVAKLVLSKITKRIELDTKQEHLYLPPNDKQNYWKGTQPYFGQSAGSWKTWLIKDGQQFKAVEPPPQDNVFWQEQVKISKKALSVVTEDQRVDVVYWAGGPGTITPPGKWLEVANTYMAQTKIPLQTQLTIRSVLAMGIADAVISVFDSKYSYWAKRPYMFDKEIYPVMPTPNHPSYPAGHSAISAAAATILTFYFPTEKDHWFDLANTAANSRLNGGIHFKYDVDQGFIQGIKVGNAAISVEENVIENSQKSQHTQ